MDVSEYARMRELEDANWWYIGKRYIVLNLINKFVQPEACRISDLLDVGCGTGATMDMLSEFGQVVGVDISEHALAFCRERGHTDLFLADISDLSFKDSSFDLITALDVIEHVEDDERALRNLWRVCRRGGFVIMSVPAHRFLWSNHDLALHHKRRYVSDELRQKVQGAGFKIVKLSYTNISTFPVVACVRGFKKLFGSKETPKPDEANLPNFLNKLMVLIYRAEASLLGLVDFPFGVSLVCVARKD